MSSGGSFQASRPQPGPPQPQNVQRVTRPSLKSPTAPQPRELPDKDEAPHPCPELERDQGHRLSESPQGTKASNRVVPNGRLATVRNHALRKAGVLPSRGSFRTQSVHKEPRDVLALSTVLENALPSLHLRPSQALGAGAGGVRSGLVPGASDVGLARGGVGCSSERFAAEEGRAAGEKL